MYNQDEFDLLDTSENTIEDDFEDLDASNDNVARVEYQVWLLGLNADDTVNDFEYMIDNYDDLVEAEKCFTFFTENPVDVIKNKDENFSIPEDVKKLQLVIEEVIFDSDGEELETNIVDEHIIVGKDNEEEKA